MEAVGIWVGRNTDTEILCGIRPWKVKAFDQITVVVEYKTTQ